MQIFKLFQTSFSPQVKINYLDSKPVTHGTVRVEVSGRHFNESRFRKLILSTRYAVQNGLVNIALTNVPIYTKTLKFKVSNSIINLAIII